MTSARDAPMPICSQCKQQMRLGVRMPVIKARLVDIVKAAGDVGISTRELHDDLYRDHAHARSVSTVGVHIHQINTELLADTQWLIAADGRGPNARLFLRQRRRQGTEAA